MGAHTLVLALRLDLSPGADRRRADAQAEGEKGVHQSHIARPGALPARRSGPVACSWKPPVVEATAGAALGAQR